MIPFLEPQRELRPTTFAEPSENVSFGERLTSLRKYLPENIAAELGSNPQAVRDLFMPAERQTMLVDTLVSSNIATEQAYDRRIAAVKAATGVDLPNPLRGGFQQEVTRAARARRDASLTQTDEEPPDIVTGGALFEQRLAELRDKHPDKLDALTFGDVRKEAEAIAKGSDEDYEAAKKATPLTPGAALVTEFGGAMWGQRRDPLFVGSLFAGPTSAVGKTVAARIATSSLFQGLYNAGISALEQPAVQQWRSEIGVKSGVMPAVENVGMAFLFGAIPGAALRGLHELGAAERLAVRRVMDGAPEPGDLGKVAARFGEGEPVQAQAIRLGEEMDEAAKITTPRPAKEVSPDLHDDLTTAAQRYADDPINQPSPEGVAAAATINYEPAVRIDGKVYRGINHGDAMERAARDLGLTENEVLARLERGDHDGFVNSDGQFVTRAEAYKTVEQQEIADRIAAARPGTLHDAQLAASEALEDIGNRDTIARTRAQMENDRIAPPSRQQQIDALVANIGNPQGLRDYATRVGLSDDQVANLIKETYDHAATAQKAIDAFKRTKAAPASSKDPLDKLPMARDDGTPTMISHQQAARAGERETKFADIIRECK